MGRCAGVVGVREGSRRPGGTLFVGDSADRRGPSWTTWNSCPRRCHRGQSGRREVPATPRPARRRRLSCPRRSRRHRRWNWPSRALPRRARKWPPRNVGTGPRSNLLGMDFELSPEMQELRQQRAAPRPGQDQAARPRDRYDGGVPPGHLRRIRGAPTCWVCAFPRSTEVRARVSWV